MSGTISLTETDKQHASLLSAVKAAKAARERVDEAQRLLQQHEGALWHAENAIRSTMQRLGERRVVLGDDLIELVDTPNGTIVQVTPVLVLP